MRWQAIAANLYTGLSRFAILLLISFTKLMMIQAMHPSRKLAVTTAEPPVLYEQDGAIVTVTLNRPRKMNNFGGGLLRTLGDSFVRFRDDPSARAAILTGNGQAFCAGGDLEEMARRSQAGSPVATPAGTARAEEAVAPEAKRRSFFESQKFTRMTNIYKPIIGAINGYCFAGGLEVALCCHFLLGAERSEYGVLNRRFSVPLLDGGTYRLRQVVGLFNALYLIQTGARIDAREAYRMGLIQEIVPDELLMGRARQIATILATVPQAGLRGDTEALIRGLGRPIEDALALEAIIGNTVLASEDFKRGPSRFAAKDFDPVTG